jgi:hypothetical protein
MRHSVIYNEPSKKTKYNCTFIIKEHYHNNLMSMWESNLSLYTVGIGMKCDCTLLAWLWNHRLTKQVCVCVCVCACVCSQQRHKIVPTSFTLDTNWRYLTWQLTSQFMLHWHTQTKKQIQSINAYSRKTYFCNETFGGTNKTCTESRRQRFKKHKIQVLLSCMVDTYLPANKSYPLHTSVQFLCNARPS